MEISQRKSLGSYLSLKQPKKMSFFSFFFYKIREQEGETGPAQVGEGYQWEGEVVGKKSRRMHIAQNMCTHVCKCKNDTC
jgi:hypothetical protein